MNDWNRCPDREPAAPGPLIEPRGVHAQCETLATRLRGLETEIERLRGENRRLAHALAGARWQSEERRRRLHELGDPTARCWRGRPPTGSVRE